MRAKAIGWLTALVMGANEIDSLFQFGQCISRFVPKDLAVQRESALVDRIPTRPPPPTLDDPVKRHPDTAIPRLPTHVAPVGHPQPGWWSRLPTCTKAIADCASVERVAGACGTGHCGGKGRQRHDVFACHRVPAPLHPSLVTSLTDLPPILLYPPLSLSPLHRKGCP